MKNIIWVVIGMTIFVLLYAVAPNLGLSYSLVFILFVMANLGLIYLVYIVLRYGEQPERKFSEGYWYSDVNKQYSKDLEGEA